MNAHQKDVGANRMKKRIADYIVYLLIRCVICLLTTLPLEACQTIARMAAILANDVLKIRRNVIYDNLTHAFPSATPRQIACMSREMWEHLVLMVCEIGHAGRKIHEWNWRHHVQVNNIKPLVESLLQPRPSVVVSGHFGNFEVAGYCLGLLGFPSFTVARPLDNPFLHDYINHFRQSKGQYIIAKQGSAGEVPERPGSPWIIGLARGSIRGPQGLLG